MNIQTQGGVAESYYGTGEMAFLRPAMVCGPMASMEVTFTLKEPDQLAVIFAKHSPSITRVPQLGLASQKGAPGLDLISNSNSNYTHVIRKAPARLLADLASSGEWATRCCHGQIAVWTSDTSQPSR
jgi:hypothetical protein